MRQAVLNMPDSDVEKQLDWFGVGGAAVRELDVAGARPFVVSAGVVPPWTEEQQQQQKKQEEKPKQ